MGNLFKCNCGKYKKCPAKNSINITGDGQVEIKSSEWFKCEKFKSQLKAIDKLDKQA